MTFDVQYEAPHDHGPVAYVGALELIAGAPLQVYTGGHAVAHQGGYVAGLDSQLGYALEAVTDYSTGDVFSKIKDDHFNPNMLLRADRPIAAFAGKAEEIESYVRELVTSVTGRDMPSDVSIEIVSKEVLKRAHTDFGGTWSDGIQGFCVNRKGQSQSTIMIREGALDSVLLTIGHEIGHSLSLPLSSKLDEEAKAFAFQMQWAKAIVEKNVAGLASSIELEPRPAQNGLHDVAFLFVKREQHKGLKALDIFHQLIEGDLQVAS